MINIQQNLSLSLPKASPARVKWPGVGYSEMVEYLLNNSVTFLDEKLED